jgi:hypothetical protein
MTLRFPSGEFHQQQICTQLFCAFAGLDLDVRGSACEEAIPFANGVRCGKPHVAFPRPPRPLPALSLRFGITLSNERDTARAEGSVARLPRVYARRSPSDKQAVVASVA